MSHNVYSKVQTQNARKFYGFILNRDVQKGTVMNFKTVGHECSINDLKNKLKWSYITFSSE